VNKLKVEETHRHKGHRGTKKTPQVNDFVAAFSVPLCLGVSLSVPISNSFTPFGFERIDNDVAFEQVRCGSD
jgi:hypothetical protein